jgi:hypothetical protein
MSNPRVGRIALFDKDPVDMFSNRFMVVSPFLFVPLRVIIDRAKEFRPGRIF